jgi:glycosyltransferase involved in cell wall biosynthesis
MARKLLQINAVVNTGSTGRITEGIGLQARRMGWDSYIGYGRDSNPSRSKVIKIGSRLDNYTHVAKTRIFDQHGLGSENATIRFVRRIGAIGPDVIHLHNLHGYYLNYEILFSNLQKLRVPIVWTLHDCWSFTGHCAYFDFVHCEQWKTHCRECPQSRSYPKSYYDNCFENYERKKSAFSSYTNLTLIPVSKWLERMVNQSFLHGCATKQIYNGVDLGRFAIREKESLKVKYKTGSRRVYLGVANTWDARKGLKDFIKLSGELKKDEVIILVGLAKRQIRHLPENIIGIERTENVDELVELYNLSEALINFTWEDNFPTVNIEALACGTPVITYKTGGSPEAIDGETGWVADKGDVAAVRLAMDELNRIDGKALGLRCRHYAEEHFDQDQCYKKYFALYEKLTNA